MNRRLRHPRGIMLFEVMMSLTLLATFAIVATQVLRTSLRVSHQASQAAGLSARFDAAVGQLRRDAWGASTFETPDAQTVRITRPDDPAITWTVDEGGSFVRSGSGTQDVGPDGDRQSWPTVGAGMSFQVDGPLLLLIEPADGRGEGRRVPLVSQLALSRGGKQQ